MFTIIYYFLFEVNIIKYHDGACHHDVFCSQVIIESNHKIIKFNSQFLLEECNAANLLFICCHFICLKFPNDNRET